MSGPNSAAAPIGRIGALAVALGIGAAVATGSGIARADAPDPGPSDSGAPTSAAPTEQGPVSQQATSVDDTSAPTRRAARATTGRKDAGPAAPVATHRRDSPAPGATGASPIDRLPLSFRVGESASPTVEAADTSSAAPQRLPASTTRLSAAIPATVAVTVPAPRPAPEAASAPTLPPAIAAVTSVAEAPQAFAAPQNLSAPVGGLAARLLAAVGLTSTAPGAPLDSPALWALMAWTRRDLGGASARSVAARAMAASSTANASIATAAVVATPPTSLGSTPIGWVTGQRNSGYPGSNWAQTNNTRWANVYGTDLGVMWFNGDNGLTQVAFGDTFSGANMTGNWRSNVLLLSDDTELFDGLTLLNTGPANQFIPAARNQVFFIGSEVTNIPSAAIYANGENYVNYFSVKSWDTPGRWTTNYSAISMYDEATDKWVLQPSTVRSAGWFRSSTRYRAGDQNFQQAAYVLQPESKVEPGGTRYVYAFGTPAGRTGSAFLSRVPEGAMTDLGQYEYWDGDTWVRDNPAVAAPIIGDSPNSAGLFGFVRDVANNPKFFGGWFAGLVGAKTGGNVSEMSVQYNEYLDKYVVMYGNGQNNVILRTAETPEGPWSAPVTVATSLQYPGLYAPLIHPLSGTGELTDELGDPDLSNLYWNMSLWGNYNVVLMQTDLTPLNTTLV
jgi:hypothetical protein